MHALLLSAVLLAPPAAATPPSGTPGLERVCASQEDPDPVGTAAATLEDEASLETAEGADLVGATLVGGDTKVAVAGDSVVYAGQVASSLTGGTAFLLSFRGIGSIHQSSTRIDVMPEGRVVYDFSPSFVQVTVYDAEGRVTASLGQRSVSGDGLSVTDALRLTGDDGSGILVAHLYGDIIIGGMCLECWDD